MARTNTLTNFLTDVADSIRSKTGKSDPIACEDFDTEIESISGGGTSRLPADYQEVDYIESSGTQCIDTGYYAKGNSRFEFKLTYGTNTGSVMGAFNTQSSWTTGYAYYHNNTTSSYEWTQYMANNSTSCKGGTNLTHEIVIDSGNVYVNNMQVYSIGAKTFTMNYSTYILASNNVGSIEQPIEAKLYYFNIKENGTLIKAFVPCYKKSDGTIGMYDIVNDVFHTNHGTGTFTKGSDVSGLNLQTKSITITENGFTSITADNGYDGLSNVDVTTEVPTGSGGAQQDVVMELKSTLPYDFSAGGCASKGTNIYLFGGETRTRAYKYDTTTGTYTALASIPYQFYDSRCVSNVGDDIYLFGGSGGNQLAYKYSITNNTYTQLANIPFKCTYSSSVAQGTNVYLFGSSTSGAITNAYKYDTLTNTYTQLANVPFNYYNAQATIIGKNVYLMGSSYSGVQNAAYKYNIDTNTYTQLANIPFNANGGARMAACMNFVYIIGGGTQPTYIYKYDTISNTYTKLTNMPYNFVQGLVATINATDCIYLLGTNANPNQLRNTMILCGSSTSYEYVQDGLIAWYEGEDDFDSNEHLNSRVGSDYLYVVARQTGDSTSLPMANYGGYTLFQNNFVLASSTDYYKTGYTIELVGFLEGINGWLITGNVSQTAGIGSQGSYKLTFQNDQDVVSASPYYYTSNKLFSASVIFTDIGTSRGNTYAYKTKGSVNGSTYLAQTARSYTHSQNSSGALTIIGGYYGNGQYRHFGGIKSIRVYNRELTEAEKNYNYGIDVQRFNLED